MVETKSPRRHCVFAAAKVGGIYANDVLPADFIYDNLAIEANIIHSAHLAGVDRLLFLGSSCVYPLNASTIAGSIALARAFARSYPRMVANLIDNRCDSFVFSGRFAVASDSVSWVAIMSCLDERESWPAPNSVDPPKLIRLNLGATLAWFGVTSKIVVVQS